MSTEKIEVCYVCSMQLYVRCTGCKTIYCSSQCQSSDSNNHKHFHAKKEQPMIKPLALQVMESRLPENVIKGIKGESIQARLARAVKLDNTSSQESLAASSSLLNVASSSSFLNAEAESFEIAGDKAEAQVKLDTDIIDLTTSDIEEDVAANFTQNLQIDPQPVAAKIPKITPVAKNLSAALPNPLAKKFERSYPIRAKDKDTQGFCKMIVTNSSNGVLYVILENNQVAVLSNQMIMNTDYESDGIPLINLDELKLYNSLVMAFIGGNWMRCKVIMGNEIYLEDIDSGKKFNLTLGNYPLKYPLERELIVPTFVYKVQLINYPDISQIAAGDLLRIRFLDENIRGILKVEVDNPPQPKKIRNEAEETLRFKIDKMKVKNFPLGNQQLMILDGKNLKSGKIHIAPSSDDSQEFYEFMYDQIMEHFEVGQPKNNYKPELGELVLVTYEDGDIYRAVCKHVQDEIYKFVLLDWGTQCSAKPEQIYMIPKNLVEIPVISRTVDVKLKSGKSLENVDVEKTVATLLEGDGFQGFVEPFGKKYSITIDDKLVTFKN